MIRLRQDSGGQALAVLIEMRSGTFAVLHVLLGGRCVRNFTGQLATLRKTILPLYAGCELRECGPLGFQGAGQAWRTAEPVETLEVAAL
jgi:hypothetical protein